MKSVYLNIGSNKGDRLANIERAVALLMEHPILEKGRIRRAPIVKSAPVGYASDAEFINLGLAFDFHDDVVPNPFDILSAIQAIEHQIAPDSPHRNSDGTYRDRVVDIDIIAIDEVTMNTERLVIPHPRAEARHFVMKPMSILAPEWHPANQTTQRTHRQKKTIAQLERESVESFKTKQKLPIAVILDNVRSQNNVGSVFRTSDAFCIEKVALCGITGTPPSPEIHKTALGAEESVDWVHYEDTLQAINDLKSQGFTILCLEQVAHSTSLDDFVTEPDKKYAVVAGNEVSGVSQAAVDASDICIEIPQAGTKHSLNVAVSTAIALWHLFSNLRKIN